MCCQSSLITSMDWSFPGTCPAESAARTAPESPWSPRHHAKRHLQALQSSLRRLHLVASPWCRRRRSEVGALYSWNHAENTWNQGGRFVMCLLSAGEEGLKLPPGCVPPPSAGTHAAFTD